MRILLAIARALQPTDRAFETGALDHAEQAAERELLGCIATRHRDRATEVIGEHTTRRMMVRVGKISIERGTLRQGRTEDRVRIDAELGETLTALTVLANMPRRGEPGRLTRKARDELTP